jgi:hypothetical protein
MLLIARACFGVCVTEQTHISCFLWHRDHTNLFCHLYTPCFSNYNSCMLHPIAQRSKHPNCLLLNLLMLGACTGKVVAKCHSGLTQLQKLAHTHSTAVPSMTPNHIYSSCLVCFTPKHSYFRAHNC